MVNLSQIVIGIALVIGFTLSVTSPVLAGACENTNSFSGGLACLRERVVDPDPALQNESLFEIITRVILYVLTYVAIITLCVLLWGGIKYIVSMGDEEKVKQAKYTIFYAIVGIMVIAASFIIIQTLRVILAGN